MTLKSKLIWLIIGMVIGAVAAYLAALLFSIWGTLILVAIFGIVLILLVINNRRGRNQEVLNG